MTVSENSDGRNIIIARVSANNMTDAALHQNKPPQGGLFVGKKQFFMASSIKTQRWQSMAFPHSIWWFHRLDSGGLTLIVTQRLF